MAVSFSQMSHSFNAVVAFFASGYGKRHAFSCVSLFVRGEGML